MIKLAGLAGLKKITPNSHYHIFANLFKRYYLRSAFFPSDLVKNHQEFYQKNFLKYRYSNIINPSANDTDLVSDNLAKYCAEKNSEELNNLLKAIEQFIDDKNCLVLEIKGLNQADNLTINHQALFKNLLVCALIHKFNFVRTKYKQNFVLGTIGDLGGLKKISDYLPLLPHRDAVDANLIPQYVAIVNIASNDHAQTFFVDNQKIIENMARQYPNELAILLETKIIVKEFDRLQEVFSTSKQSFCVVEKVENNQYKINLFSDRFKMFLVSQNQITRDDFIKAVFTLKKIVINHQEQMKIVLNSDNQVVFFKNQALLHGRSGLSSDKYREVNYLPFEDSIIKKMKTNTEKYFYKKPSPSLLSALTKFSKLKDQSLKFLS